MKLTEKQQEEMKHLKEDATKYIKENKSRSIRNLQFEILNMRDARYPSLDFLKVSVGWVGKLKQNALQAKSKSIVKEVQEKDLLSWFKKRKANMLTALVTTPQVKATWKKIFGKNATEYGLLKLKRKHGIHVVYSAQTKNTNTWEFRN